MAERKRKKAAEIQDLPAVETQLKETAGLQVPVNLKNFKPSKLTKERKDMLVRVGSTLSVTDMNSVINYGSELQKVMSSNADGMIANARASKAGDIGDLVTNLLSELNMIDIEEITDAGTMNGIKRFMRKVPVLRSLVKTVEQSLIKYDTVKENLEDIEKKIMDTKIIAMRDNTTLQEMYDNNLSYIEQIGVLVDAGKEKLYEVYSDLQAKETSEDGIEIHERNAYLGFINRLDKKIDDLGRVKYVLQQNLLQIQAVQENNHSIAEKAANISTTTIPLWKSQISLAVALADQKNSIEAQKKITDATNELLEREAKMLKQNSIAVAKENERAIIDTETLRKTQQDLIETVQQVRQIHEEGMRKRREANEQLQQLSQQLVDNLSGMSAEFDQIASLQEPPETLKEIEQAAEPAKGFSD